MPSSFEADFPAITRWIKEFGYIEIGGASFADFFVKAVDRDGIQWGGKREYMSIDEALKDMERGVEKLLVEQVMTSSSRTGKSPSKKSLETKHRAAQNQHRSDEERKAIKKVEKLEAIAPALRQNEMVSVTRLTVVKGLCADPKAASAFALFLARKIQRRMRENDAPKRYRQLVNRAVREMGPYLDEPSEEKEKRLWSLLREIEAEQDEYENIPFGVVRNIKSFDLLTAEHALKAVLKPDEAPYWLYHAARDSTGKTGELIPKSDKLHTPFTARCIRERAISPLRIGEEVEIVGMAPEVECRHQMFVETPWEHKRTLAVPLSRLQVVHRDQETRRAVEDWHYWVEMGYGS
jgi:hypothetical protein